MTCRLYSYKKESATHYVGITGNEYPIDKYCNWGTGEKKHGKADLPKDEYPYTIKYSSEPYFKQIEFAHM